MLERQWNKVVDQAQRYAAKGMSRETFDVFEPYRNIHDKYAAMAPVIAQLYCVQLEHKLRAKAPQEEIERGIRQYVEIFGIDEGITIVYEYFKSRYSTKLDLEMLRQGSFDTWTPSIRISDITVGS